MRLSEFDRQIVSPLIVFIVGLAIAFIVGLIAIRKTSRSVNFRRVEEKDRCELTKEQILLSLSCAIFPMSGYGLARFVFGYSFQGQIVLTSLGFLIAVFILAIGIWRMGKKDT